MQSPYNQYHNNFSIIIITNIDASYLIRLTELNTYMARSHNKGVQKTLFTSL